jgi:hypothetical protein
MLLEIIQNFAKEIKETFSVLEKEIRQKLDLSVIEGEIIKIVNKFVAKLLEILLNNFFRDGDFWKELKELGGHFALKYKEYRDVKLRLWNGETITVSTPYFLKTLAKKNKKKRGKNGSGSYLGLEVLGVIEHCSPNLISDVVQMALLCPSLEVSKVVLSRRGIEMDVKTIRHLCNVLGGKGLLERGKISLNGTEDLKGKTLVIGIDGGRLRLRGKKAGGKNEGQKREGFSADWREPKLFTFYLLDEKGEIDKEFIPIHDATMGNYKEMFVLLEQYLKVLNPETVERIVFCGDGDDTIWLNVEELLKKINVPTENIFQVLDYSHAKQNLYEIIGLVSFDKRIASEKEFKDLLWKGDIAGIEQLIHKLIPSKKNRGKALKKWRNYFQKNEKRMQYENFKELLIPRGSGHVESAIRRVINLRLKAPGTFWTKEMAECFLFLRSQLISGRWDIFIKNITQMKRIFLLPQCQSEVPLLNKKETHIFDLKIYNREETFSNAA